MRISSLDCTRVIAIAAIMALHVAPFASPFNPAPWAAAPYAWIADFINQAGRFAVPFFFLCAGYFVQPKLSAETLAPALRYCRPILLLWVLWSLIYAFLPMDLPAVLDKGYVQGMQGQWGMLLAHPLDLLLVGGMLHLWFLPALMLAVLMIAGAHRLRWENGLLPLAIALYLIGLAGGSYAKLLDIQWDFNTRNGPFFALPLVLAGVLLRQTGRRLGDKAAIGLMLGGMLLYLVELWGLNRYAQSGFRGHDFLLGSLPWALGLFWLLLNHPQWGRDSWLEKQAPNVLGIYCLHMYFVAVMLIGTPGVVSIAWEAAKLPLLLILVAVSMWTLSRAPALKVLVRKA
ncbi:fucose 4-O-acetylase [Chromobacterium sinusclupearum]|uniref:Fucose 4-O-acetylase n=1 Tax=Chromobacterium sinusclupearum TaxID=2077146 RepID=A0A2K4MMD8_9NEIS|nr:MULTISPECIES: acyltransferase family protein [Chromobacterium]POA98264.1 fucose 4-O-acetylase [Chromobacterium sinusclupearum]